MRNQLLIATLLCATACGGSAGEPATTTSPPPPPPASPASVVVQQGSNQNGEVDKPLPIRPSVKVLDASAKPVSNVSVSFVADSGGGSVTGGTATTGVDGVATAGDWILGPQEVTNVVKATVNGLPPVYFRAQGNFPVQLLLDSATAGFSGSTLTYVKSGDPLDGLAIEVPTRAFPTSTKWSVVARPREIVQLPAGFLQVGPTLEIGNGRAYADSVFFVTIPAKVGRDTIVAPYFRDPSSGTLEPVPLIARDARSITIATRHVSADRLLLPAGAPALRAALRTAAPAPPPFGKVQLVLVALPASRVKPVQSLFRVGTDDWEFPNLGSYASPKGQCAGQSISAMHYFYKFRLGGGPPLFGRWDTDAVNPWDNPNGIRLATAAQLDGDWTTALSYTAQVRRKQGQFPSSARDELVYQTVALNLQLNGMPIFLGLRNTANPDGHAVVVTGVTATALEIADPNAPGTVRSIAYNNGFAPTPFRANANAPAQPYDEFLALGVSAFISMAKLDARWQEMTLGDVAPELYPPGDLEYQNEAAQSWEPLTNTVSVPTLRFIVRHMCAACPFPRTDVTQINRQPVAFFDAQGNVISNDENQSGADLMLVKGANSVGIMRLAKLQSGQSAFVNYRRITVTGAGFAIDPNPFNGSTGTPYQFMVRHQGMAKAGFQFKWTVIDDQFKVVSTKTTPVPDSTFTVTFAKDLKYTLQVDLFNASGTRVAVDLVFADIRKAEPYWRVESFTQLFARPGPITRPDEQTVFNTYQAMFTRLMAAPAAGMFILDNVPAASGNFVLSLKVLPTATWPDADCCPPTTPGATTMALGRSPTVSNTFGPVFSQYATSYSQSSADLNIGTMTSMAVDGSGIFRFNMDNAQEGPLVIVQFSGTRTGKVLEGSITVTGNLRFPDGYISGSYIYQYGVRAIRNK